MERIAIFVDGANVYYAQKNRLGWFFDPRRLLHYLSRGRYLYNAFWYTGVQSPADPKQEDFLNALISMGYTVRRKPLKTVYGDEGEGRHKANLDIEIAVDMFATAPRYDQAILLSGDGDFERAVEYLRAQGKEITVVSTQGVISMELRNAADHYIDFQEIRDEIFKGEYRGA